MSGPSLLPLMRCTGVREVAAHRPSLMSLTLVYDGGCPFCRHFALRSELAAGVDDLRIVDGRQDNDLRHRLRSQGLDLTDGAVLLEGSQAWHGSAAIAELSRRMQPSDPLLHLLQGLFRDQHRAGLFYPALLLARRVALALRGLRPDPDA